MVKLAQDVAGGLPNIVLSMLASWWHKHTLHSRLRDAFADDRQALENYWYAAWPSVCNGPGDNISDLERYRRFAYTDLPAWQHHNYMDEFAAKRLAFSKDIVTRINAQAQEFSNLKWYQDELRKQFEEEDGRKLWNTYTAWKKAFEDGEQWATDRRTHMTAEISRFCDREPCITLWRTVNAQVQSIRQAGSPMAGTQHSERSQGQQSPANTGLV